MKINKIFRWTIIAAVFSCFSFLQAAVAQDYLHEGPILIKNVSYLDGLGNLPKKMRDILLQDGKIVKLAQTTTLGELPENTKIINGKGLTAMPGFFDLHVHTAATAFKKEEVEGKSDEGVQKTLNALLYSGVTTILDIGNDQDHIVGRRDAIDAGESMGPKIVAVGEIIPRLHSVTGTGNMYSSEVQAEINELLDKRQATGIEMVKTYGGFSNWELRHFTEAAHKRGMRVIADMWCSNLGRATFEATNVDAFAHASCSPLPEHEAKWMYDNGKFAMMTLTAFDYMGSHRAYDDFETKGFLKDPLVVKPMGKKLVNEYYETFHQTREWVNVGHHSFFQSQLFPDLPQMRPDAQITVKRLHDAGVLVGLGTDTVWPPGNWPGESFHNEMLLHAEAEISNVDVIKMATINGAKILKLEDTLGSIEQGKVADIVLVEGDPSKDINDTRNITHVIKGGKLVNRRALESR